MHYDNGSYNVGTVGVAYWHIVAVRFPEMTMSSWPENVPNEGFVASNLVSTLSIHMVTPSRVYKIAAHS